MSTSNGIPIIANFDRDGGAVGHMGDKAPEDCDHAGQCWSGDMGVRCVRCGVRLFAPPRHLARRPRAVVEEMHRLWAAAGRPDLMGSLFGRWAWVDTESWVLIQHPLFEHAGGLPVRRELLAVWWGES